MGQSFNPMTMIRTNKEFCLILLFSNWKMSLRRKAESCTLLCNAAAASSVMNDWLRGINPFPLWHDPLLHLTFLTEVVKQSYETSFTPPHFPHYLWSLIRIPKGSPHYLLSRYLRIWLENKENPQINISSLQSKFWYSIRDVNISGM